MAPVFAVSENKKASSVLHTQTIVEKTERAKKKGWVGGQEWWQIPL